MAKRRGNPNNMDIRGFFSPSKKQAMDAEKASGDKKKGKESTSEEGKTTDGSSILKDLNHKPKMKIEEATGSEEGHSHEFIFKFKTSDTQYIIQCDHPQTVLQAIKSKPELQEKINCDEDKIILQKGEARLDTTIATHFPCTLLKVRELVVLETKNEQVEVRETQRDYGVHQDEQYYVMYIQTKGGIHTRSKPLFRSSLMKTFSRLCVYGTENMSLKDAIERDGRFVELGNFKLEYLTKSKTYVFSDDKIQKLHGNAFKICLGKSTSKKAGQAMFNDTAEAGPNNTEEEASKRPSETSAMGAAAPSTAWHAVSLSKETPLRWDPVSEVLKRNQAASDSKENKEILDLLRAQYPELKKQLLNRYQGILTKEDFGKAQQAFSDVFRLEKLLKLGKSVCKIIISNTCEGTGFVLFKQYILTNAHLFDAVIYNKCLQPDLQTTVIFNYEEPHQQNTLNFQVKNTFIDYDKGIDYAILELEVNEENESQVPPGLMKHCSPMPESGEACLIGHPSGGVKRFDPTCIIEKKNREKEIKKNLQQFNNDMSMFCSVRDHIQKQGIERILCPSDPLYPGMASYNTFMYHGSSGSPVFDAECRVFGMHTGGFTYDRPTKGSVIEYARPLLLIFHQFVTKISKNSDLLKAVKEESKDNPYLRDVLTDEEPMDES